MKYQEHHDLGIVFLFKPTIHQHVGYLSVMMPFTVCPDPNAFPPPRVSDLVYDTFSCGPSNITEWSHRMEHRFKIPPTPGQALLPNVATLMALGW